MPLQEDLRADDALLRTLEEEANKKVAEDAPLQAFEIDFGAAREKYGMAFLDSYFPKSKTVTIAYLPGYVFNIYNRGERADMLCSRSRCVVTGPALVAAGHAAQHTLTLWLPLLMPARSLFLLLLLLVQRRSHWRRPRAPSSASRSRRLTRRPAARRHWHPRPRASCRASPRSRRMSSACGSKSTL